MSEEFILQLDDGPDMVLEMNEDPEIEIQLDAPVGGGTTDYMALTNKPSISGVVLVGNLTLADLFPQGIIIDGGDSTEEVVP
jgi:hypothetical protein